MMTRLTAIKGLLAAAAYFPASVVGIRDEPLPPAVALPTSGRAVPLRGPRSACHAPDDDVQAVAIGAAGTG
jgi:hypothetical protein